MPGKYHNKYILFSRSMKNVELKISNMTNVSHLYTIREHQRSNGIKQLFLEILHNSEYSNDFRSVLYMSTPNVIISEKREKIVK